jgi:hypothetical protein
VEECPSCGAAAVVWKGTVGPVTPDTDATDPESEVVQLGKCESCGVQVRRRTPLEGEPPAWEALPE